MPADGRRARAARHLGDCCRPPSRPSGQQRVHTRAVYRHTAKSSDSVLNSNTTSDVFETRDGKEPPFIGFGSVRVLVNFLNGGFWFCSVSMTMMVRFGFGFF